MNAGLFGELGDAHLPALAGSGEAQLHTCDNIDACLQPVKDYSCMRATDVYRFVRATMLLAVADPPPTDYAQNCTVLTDFLGHEPKAADFKRAGINRSMVSRIGAHNTTLVTIAKLLQTIPRKPSLGEFFSAVDHCTELSARQPDTDSQVPAVQADSPPQPLVVAEASHGDPVPPTLSDLLRFADAFSHALVDAAGRIDTARSEIKSRRTHRKISRSRTSTSSSRNRRA